MLFKFVYLSYEDFFLFELIKNSLFKQAFKDKFEKVKSNSVSDMKKKIQSQNFQDAKVRSKAGLLILFLKNNIIKNLLL